MRCCWVCWLLILIRERIELVNRAGRGAFHEDGGGRTEGRAPAKAPPNSGQRLDSRVRPRAARSCDAEQGGEGGRAREASRPDARGEHKDGGCWRPTRKRGAKVGARRGRADGREFRPRARGARQADARGGGQAASRDVWHRTGREQHCWSACKQAAPHGHAWRHGPAHGRNEWRAEHDEGFDRERREPQLARGFGLVHAVDAHVRARSGGGVQAAFRRGSVSRWERVDGPMGPHAIALGVDPLRGDHRDPHREGRKGLPMEVQKVQRESEEAQ